MNTNRKNIDDCYDDLTIAIVKKAKEDYLWATWVLKHIDEVEPQHPSWITTARGFKITIPKFFKSNHGDVLTFGHGIQILDQIKQEASLIE